MSFNNTKTHTMSEFKKKPKYAVERVGVYGVCKLSPEQESELKRLYPITFNFRLMEMFGISHSTLHRFARQYALSKKMDVIKHKQAQQIKKKCEENGYYDSLRGKPLGDEVHEGSRRLRATGFHPLKALKEKNPRKYKAICKARGEKRKTLIKKERRFREYGIKRINLHLPNVIYDTSQVSARYNARKRGYILGDKSEYSGERYTIFYDENTQRAPIFERNCE